MNPATLGDVEDVDYRGCNIDHNGSGVGVATVDPGETYVFPNIRSGPGIVAATIIDDETADLITIESGTDTVVQKCGNDLCTIPDPAGDTFQIRLTKRPEVLDDDDHSETPVEVNVAILLDGLSDVVQIGYDTNDDGTPDSFDNLWTDTNLNGAIEGSELTGYDLIGGDVPSQRFLGNVIVTDTTITRANGSELGSFGEEGLPDRPTHPHLVHRCPRCS